MATFRVTGTVLPEAERRELFVVDGHITYAPTPAERAAAVTLADDVWLLPGFVDAHCHVGLGPHGAVDRTEQEHQAVTDRDAGTLLARDCGSPADTRWIDDRDDLPRLIRAGRHLARTRRYLRHYGLELEPPDLPAAAAEQARAGDGWVKIVADWIDRERGDLAPCWPAEALAAAVQQAHDAGARVTAHVFGEEAIDALLDAGVDCLEHGTGLTQRQLERMAADGVALVPTLINIETFPDIARRAARYPAYAAHMRSLHGRVRGMVRAAYDAGVAIFAGTDAGGSIEHGRVADEMRALFAAGLPIEAALGAASWRAREWLGHPPMLDEGVPGDLVVLPADPRHDPSALSAPLHVLLRGEVRG
jgi:imidazolonepropionase-like amidohydrolase